MRNLNSSLIIWIGITLASLVWHYCLAYPDGRDKNFDQLIQQRDVNSINTEDAAAVINLPVQLHHYPLADKSIYEILHPAKEHVSIPVTNLKTVETRKIRNTFSIDEDSNEEDLTYTDIDLTILDDLPKTLIHTIEEDKNSVLRAILNETNNGTEYLTNISNALYSSNFWNSIAQQLFEVIPSFLGLPTIDILQINGNNSKKRQSRWSTTPIETTIRRSPISQIIQQFMPVTATRLQQDEMCKCINDTTTELQNLLNQLKTACINIRDGFSVVPFTQSNSSTCKNSGFLESAPILIKNLIDNPEQITNISEILQSSVPSSQISDSADKLKNSLKKIFGLLQKMNSESEELDCQQEKNEKNQSIENKKTLEKINKHLECWKTNKLCKSENCNNKNCDKCSSNQIPNTMILTIPSSVSTTVPSVASSLNPIHTKISAPIRVLASVSSIPALLPGLTSLPHSIPISILNSASNSGSTADWILRTNSTLSPALNGPFPSSLSSSMIPQINLNSDLGLISNISSVHTPLTTTALLSSYTALSNLSVAPELTSSLTSNLFTSLTSASNLTRPSGLNSPSNTRFNSTSILSSNSAVAANFNPSSTSAVSTGLIVSSPSNLFPASTRQLIANKSQYSVSTTSPISIPSYSKTIKNLGSSIQSNDFTQDNNNNPNYSRNSNSLSNVDYLSNNYPKYYGNSDFLTNSAQTTNNYPNVFENSDSSAHSNYPGYPTYFEYSNIPGRVPISSSKNAGPSVNSISSVASSTYIKPIISSIPCVSYEITSPNTMPLSSPIVLSPWITSNPVFSVGQLQSVFPKSILFTKMKSVSSLIGNSKSEVSPIISQKISSSKQDSLKSKVAWLLSLADSKSVESQPELQSIPEPCLPPVIPSLSTSLCNKYDQNQYISSTPKPYSPSIVEPCSSPEPISSNPSIPETYSPFILEPYSSPEQETYSSTTPNPCISRNIEPYTQPYMKSCSQISNEVSSIPKTICLPESMNERNESIASDCSKKNNKFNKLLNLRYITQRSPGSKCKTYPDSRLLPYIDEENRTRVQELQINVPTTTSQLCQATSIIPNQFITSTSSTNPLSQTASIILPSINSAITNSPKFALDRVFPTEISTTYSGINSKFPEFQKAQKTSSLNELNVYPSYQTQSWYRNYSPQNEYSNIHFQNSCSNIPSKIEESNSSWKNKYANVLWSNNNPNSPSESEYPNLNSQNESFNTWESRYYKMPWKSENFNAPIQNENTNTKLFNKYPQSFLENKRSDTSWYFENSNLPSESIMINTLSDNRYPYKLLQNEAFVTSWPADNINTHWQSQRMNSDALFQPEYSNSYFQGTEPNSHWQTKNSNSHTQTRYWKASSSNKNPSTPLQDETNNVHFSQQYPNYSLFDGDLNVSCQNEHPSILSSTLNFNLQSQDMNANVQSVMDFNSPSEESNTSWHLDSFIKPLEAENTNNISKNKNITINLQEGTTNVPWQIRNLNNPLQISNLNIPSQSVYLNTHPHEEANSYWQNRNHNFFSDSLISNNPFQSGYFHIHSHDKNTSAPWRDDNNQSLPKNRYFNSPSTNINLGENMNTLHKNFNTATKGRIFTAPSQITTSTVSEQDIYSNVLSKGIYSDISWKEKSSNFPVPNIYTNIHSNLETSNTFGERENSNGLLQTDNSTALSSKVYPNTYMQLGIINAPLQNRIANYSIQSENQNGSFQSTINSSWQDDKSKFLITDGYIKNQVQDINTNEFLHVKNSNIISESIDPNVHLQSKNSNIPLTNKNLKNTLQGFSSNSAFQKKHLNSHHSSKYLNIQGKNVDSSLQEENPTISLKGENLINDFQNKNHNILFYSKNVEFTKKPNQLNTALQIENSNLSLRDKIPNSSPQNSNINSDLNSDYSVFLNVNKGVDTSSKIRQDLDSNYQYQSNVPYISSGITYPNIPAHKTNSKISLQNKNSNLPYKIKPLNRDIQTKDSNISIQNENSNLKSQNGNLNISSESGFPYIFSTNLNSNIPFQSINPNIPVQSRISILSPQNKDFNGFIQDKNNNKLSEDNNQNQLSESRYSSVPLQDIHLNTLKSSTNNNASSQRTYSNVLLQGINDDFNVEGGNNVNIIPDRNNNILPQSENFNITFQGSDHNIYLQSQYPNTILPTKNPAVTSPAQSKISNNPILFRNPQRSSENSSLISSLQNEKSNSSSQNPSLKIPLLSGDINASIQNRYPFSESENSYPILSDEYSRTSFQTGQPYTSIEIQSANDITKTINPTNSLQSSYPSKIEISQHNELEVERNQSPIDKLESTVSALGDALTVISSLIIPDTLNNKSPLETIGFTTSSVLADVISEASSLMTSDSKNKNFGLDSLGIADFTVANAIDRASSLIPPKLFDEESPVEQIENTASTMLDAISESSSFITPQLSQSISYKGKTNMSDVINNAASKSADSISSTSLLLNSRIQSNHRYLENKQPKKSHATNYLQTGYSIIPHKVNYAESLVAPVSLQKPGISTHSLSKSIVTGPELVSSTIANSVASMANSAAIVANSLASTIKQLASQNLQRTDLLYIPPSTRSTTLVAPPQSVAQATSITSSPTSQNINLYRPKSQTGIQEDAQISLALPRDKISAVVNGGIIIPGDVITIALNNQATLVGKVIDSESPISFNIIKRNNRESLPLQGNRNWNISSNECKDRELQNILQQVSTNIII